MPMLAGVNQEVCLEEGKSGGLLGGGEFRAKRSYSPHPGFFCKEQNVKKSFGGQVASPECPNVRPGSSHLQIKVYFGFPELIINKISNCFCESLPTPSLLPQCKVHDFKKQGKSCCGHTSLYSTPTSFSIGPLPLSDVDQLWTPCPAP